MTSVTLYLECTLKDNETLYKHCELHNDGDEPHRNIFPGREGHTIIIQYPVYFLHTGQLQEEKLCFAS